MYIVEFKRVESNEWERSGNRGASGEFKTYEAAQEVVREQEKHMGYPYRYRATKLGGKTPTVTALQDKLNRIHAVLQSPTKLDQINTILEEE